MTNPYALEHDLEVSYAGYLRSGAYAYRLNLGDAKAMESCMFQMKVSQWLFDNLMPHEWTMGNDTTGTNLANPDDSDVFVIFDALPNAIQFEGAFKVTGLTPAMLV